MKYHIHCTVGNMGEWGWDRAGRRGGGWGNCPSEVFKGKCQGNCPVTIRQSETTPLLKKAFGPPGIIP